MPTEEGCERGAAVSEETAVGVPIGVESLKGRATCSVGDAARLLQIGRSTAYSAARDGSLPVLRISNRILVSVPRLMTMLGVESESRS